MLGDLDAAEKDYATSVELGHIPATAKLRALRKQKAKELEEAAAAGTGATATGDVNESVAVPVRRHLARSRVLVLDRQFSLHDDYTRVHCCTVQRPPPPELDINALLSALPAVPGANDRPS